ncbi:cytochrome P450 CYP82D47-like isoform X1 [Rosa rugosa]|uniref:cytochrome P450 CYP82D47-like isoform X1 n=2 Tax=Rosa rugosa TaxID=74645 RepID=UPI002B40C9AB|nr:cytochrome P450 CYP82D47-like isoform X1 [Rosa rugosa]
MRNTSKHINPCTILNLDNLHLQVSIVPMEFLLPSSICDPTTILAFVLLLFSFVWITKYLQKNTAKNRGPPEAAGAWPILGHLPLLGGPQPPHVILGNMADKYGPVFTIKLGVHRALIVSSWDVAKECLTTNDKAFANRPKALCPEIMGYDYAMFGFSPYGPYWRQVRKIATLHILSNHKLELLKHVLESEVKVSTKHIFDMWERNKGVSNKVLVDMKRWFGDLTLNVMFRMVVGKRFFVANSAQENEENERYRKALREFSRLGGEFVISDAVPYLRLLDLGGYEKAMKKTAKELDGALQKWLEEHQHKRRTNYLQHDCEHDFMDMMLTVLDDDSTEEFAGSITADTIIKATCLAVLLGGTDTTTVTLTWAVSLLLNNPEVLKKAQLELDNHVGRERQVNESDVKNLAYLQAIVKETLRLYPAGPLSVPHESREDCTIGNYHVSSGTRLLINLSKIHRDPNVWFDPCLFQPERFLTTHKNVDVRGQSFELTPFGSGRRVCPGISLALQITQLALAHLLHGFEITTSSDEPVDMGESLGIANMKTTPLEVLLTPRLHPKLYENVD